MYRTTEISRKTYETDICIKLNLDGMGKSEVDTGIGFFDHMLTLFSKHGLIDLNISCKGDLETDSHHSVEDVGIVLGQAISKALGDKASISRYGSAYVPMDETLARVVIDLSSRPFLYYDIPFTRQELGNMAVEMVEEFFRAVSNNAGITLHIEVLHGTNNHHMAEAVFKAFGRALRQAVIRDEKIIGVPSTKGLL
ncbi:MAG: imidazoleglycerol-phosphate dehydratase HisB [Desulfitobacteriaceae bacterium]|jgi:imidazoleglycerol-phosphate dehydratase|nr:imidazoleglycerol-phosphate dehydratase HisB [Desulfitobacteriaceae bacterium]MDD4296920.1 imidazoleglycerol-phosphate dehydratase HisB [Ruminiclostridium sp.]